MIRVIRISDVSMPPRRSCFIFDAYGVPQWVWGFNATTAFLLLSPSLSPSDSNWRFNATTAFLLRERFRSPFCRDTGVSMPPRRSCFNGLR